MNIKKIGMIGSNETLRIMRDNRKACNEPDHSHEFVELEYVVAGSGIQIINGTKYQANIGDVFFFNIGDHHSYRSIKDLEIINLIFPESIYEDKKLLLEQTVGKPENLALPHYIKLTGNSIFEAEQLLSSIEKELIKKRDGYNTVIRSYLSVLFIVLIRNINSAKDPAKDALPIIEYLNGHYKTATLTEIATHFNFSRTYFCKYFKNLLGVTFSEYITSLKISEAIDLLKNTNETIESICYKVGFKDKKLFYGYFKKNTGTTPYLYRQNIKK